MLQNVTLLAIVAIHTAANELSKVRAAAQPAAQPAARPAAQPAGQPAVQRAAQTAAKDPEAHRALRNGPQHLTSCAVSCSAAQLYS